MRILMNRCGLDGVATATCRKLRAMGVAVELDVFDQEALAKEILISVNAALAKRDAQVVDME